MRILTISTLVLFALSTTTAFAFLGATLEECEAEYGKVQRTGSLNGQTVRGFLVPLGVLKNTLVFATFNKDGRVEEINYKGRTNEEFTESQLNVIIDRSTPDPKKPFVETGLAPDKSKKMWARADYSAYVVSEEDSPNVTIFTQEAALKFFKGYEKK